MTPRINILEQIRKVAYTSMPKGSRMLLFGSQARNEAREDSDWDILILLDKSRIDNEDFNQVAYPIVELGWRMGIAINPILYTFAEWQKRHFTPFYKNVESEGIELCH